MIEKEGLRRPVVGMRLAVGGPLFCWNWDGGLVG